MSWLTDIIVLMAIIFMVNTMLALRAILSYPFCSRKLQLSPEGSSIPESMADLLAQASPSIQQANLQGPLLLTFIEEGWSTDRIFAAYRHGHEHTILLLGTPDDLLKPNTLISFVITKLVDGRIATSQAYDSFSEVYSTPQNIGQTVAAKTPQELLSQHHHWIHTTLKSSPVNTPILNLHELKILCEQSPNQTRDELISQKKLILNKQGLPNASFGFALKIFKALLRTPRLSPNHKPIPIARLNILAKLRERTMALPVPLRVQISLQLVSLLLFVLIGIVFWDVYLVISILIIIIIHELGHFICMKLCGYQQVHILMLPLVGGITMGQEQKRNTAHRIWVALAGPLPGLFISCLFIYHYHTLTTLNMSDAGATLLPSLLSFFMLMFIINYINLLPIPPLDGGRVIQALLAQNNGFIQIGFIIISCLLGVLFAWLADFFIFAIFALIPLMNIKNIYITAKAKKVLNAANHHAPLTITQALYALEHVAGTTAQALPRIDLALDLTAESQRMTLSTMQYSLFIFLYFISLILPLLFIGLFYPIAYL